MAVDILNDVGTIRRPSRRSDRVPWRNRIGAGRGRGDRLRRFAYDLWGDTMNLASRLEENAEPGRILVSESTAGELIDRGPLRSPRLEVKGKGPYDRPGPLGPPVERSGHGAPSLRGRMTAGRFRRSSVSTATVVVVCAALTACTDSDAGPTRPPSTGGEEVIDHQHVRRLRGEPDRRRDVRAGPGTRRLCRRATARPAVLRGFAERLGGGLHRREAGVPVVVAPVPRPERGSDRRC